MNKNKNKKQNFFCSVTGLNDVFKDVLICKCIKKETKRKHHHLAKMKVK